MSQLKDLARHLIQKPICDSDIDAALAKSGIKFSIVGGKRIKDTNSLNLTGVESGYLKVLQKTKYKSSTSILWACQCICGEIILCRSNLIKSGVLKSCGCMKGSLISSARTKHGHARNRTLVYVAWKSMLARCGWENHKSYAAYGGAGILVCDRWKSFINFYEDMGDRPPGTTLDRKDNNLGYFKENCRWATPKEQANNRKNNRLITYKGESKTVSQWSECMNIPRDTLAFRLKAGWDVERAFHEKVFHGKNIGLMNQIRMKKHHDKKLMQIKTGE